MTLRPCPSSPNCVSSLAGDARHRIDPLPYTGTGPETLAALARIIAAMDRSRIVARTDAYLHAEFRSAIFGFTDDLELLCDDDQRVVHLRSAARTGYYDFNVNRKRVEALRRSLQAL